MLRFLGLFITISSVGVDGYELDEKCLPFGKNATESMQSARNDWLETKVKTTLEFVHIHKCSGMSVENMAPEILYGSNESCTSNMSAYYQMHKKWPKCSVRPIDMTDASSMHDFILPIVSDLEYISSRFEVGAYELLPWLPKRVIKVIFVREPWQRYKSDQGYSCLKFGRKFLHHSREAQHLPPHIKHRYYRPIIEDHFLPPSERYAPTLSPKDEIARKQRAVLRIQAFGFIGIVEHFADSACLFARAFAARHDPSLRKRLLCAFCCPQFQVSKQFITPHENAHDYRDPACTFVYTREDTTLYLAQHRNDDLFVYQTALDVFRQRRHFAIEERWGGLQALDDADFCSACSS